MLKSLQKMWKRLTRKSSEFRSDELPIPLNLIEFRMKDGNILYKGVYDPDFSKEYFVTTGNCVKAIRDYEWRYRKHN